MNGCQVGGGLDLCGVSFAKYTGGWVKTGLPLKSDKAVKRHISNSFKDWQNLNKLSSRLSKPNLTSKHLDMVEKFKTKLDSTCLICDDKAEEIIAKDRLRDENQMIEDIA